MTPIENIYICCISPIWWVVAALQTGQTWCCNLMSQLLGEWQGLQGDPHIPLCPLQRQHNHSGGFLISTAVPLSIGFSLALMDWSPKSGCYSLHLHPETCTARQCTRVTPVHKKSSISDPWCCSSRGHVCLGWTSCSYRDFTFQCFSGRAVVTFCSCKGMSPTISSFQSSC